jgi:RIO-like serine/threonine protein kinase
MQALKLCEENGISLPYLGKELGYGADGQVFEAQNDKVIKIAVCFDPSRPFTHIQSVMQYLIKNNPSSYASVYHNEYLGEYTRQYYNCGVKTAIVQKYYLHYYIMEKLFKISEDERKIFHTILSHEDRNIVKNYPLDKVKKMLTGMSYSLDFDYNKVIFFYQNLRDCPLQHLDLHVRNIMKDIDGNFKMIDFDRMKLESGL